MPSSSHRACDDFRQTSAARRAHFLDAPLTRRRLIGAGFGAGLAVYAAKAMPMVRMLEAAEAEAAVAPNAPVLVSVFLPGGVDLLDTLVPLGQFGAYADVRKGTRVQNATPLGSTGLGMHPSLGLGANGGIQGLFDAGKIGLLPGIDYANPDLSHFHSRHFWETGLVSPDPANGWLGRWLDKRGASENPFQGLTMGSTLSPAIRTASTPVAAVSSPDDAQFWIRDTWGQAYDKGVAAWSRIAERRPAGAGPASVHGATRLARDVAARLKPYTSDEKKGDPLAPPVPYPDSDDNPLAERLSRLAGLLALPLGIRVATIDADSDFDTHDNQPTELAKGLKGVSESLSAFQSDIEARGLADRVLTLVWTEFGRRPEGNESNGTDHGAGGLAWVMGTRAAGGVLSEYPSLSKLDREGNLAVTVDFRRVYASLLEQWLGTDAGAVMPSAGSIGRLQLVR
jgi:uncharacterized protein (DUF1501 family)